MRGAETCCYITGSTEDGWMTEHHEVRGTGAITAKETEMLTG